MFCFGFKRFCLSALPLFLLPVISAAQSRSANGLEIFIKNCAACHRSNSGTRAPLPEVLQQMPREAIVRALETGLMKQQGASLSADEKNAVAAYLSRARPVEPITKGICPANAAPQAASSASWNGWGAGLDNARFQAADKAGIERDQIQKLKLKWAFGFPEGGTAAQPVAAGGRVFVGSAHGLYALDARSGCMYWMVKTPSGVRAAVSISPDGQTAFFADSSATVYAVSTATGEVKWKTQADSYPSARVTGAPVLAENRLYVPMSSGEEASAINPYYECCKFRGSLVALDALTGKIIWRTYAIPQEPKIVGKNAKGVTVWGPSGAPIWSAPTVDLKRGLVYAATGNNYSEPPDEHSDAIEAFDLKTGKMMWVQQLLKSDRWNLSCLIKIDVANCPPNAGDDYDFGASPILVPTKSGKTMLLVAQKSGDLYALDPDQGGKVIWGDRIAKGGALGGFEWGGAVADGVGYYSISDWRQGEPKAGGGLVAINVEDGKRIWQAPPIAPTPECAGTRGCSAAQIAPVTVIPGVVFSGSMDGHLRAYGSKDGKVFWDFNTARPFETVDQVAAHGGSLNASGPAVAGGMLYMTSGQQQGMPGNVVIALSVDGR
jgi:polyvinyl alcohol dehydrogenase (cytochrome)